MWTSTTSISKIKSVTNPTLSYYRKRAKTCQVLYAPRFNFRVYTLLNLTGLQTHFKHNKAGLSVLEYEY